eukprot:701409-Pyramimonas_sp.AAC.1
MVRLGLPPIFARPGARVPGVAWVPGCRGVPRCPGMPGGARRCPGVPGGDPGCPGCSGVPGCSIALYPHSSIALHPL